MLGSIDDAIIKLELEKCSESGYIPPYIKDKDKFLMKRHKDSIELK